VLNVNLFQLVDDFVRGVHEFISELKKAKKRRIECQNNYNEISRQLSVKELAKKNKKMKRNLNLQISRAVRAQRLEVQNGNVIGGKCS
jgi:hypothetical protein